MPNAFKENSPSKEPLLVHLGNCTRNETADLEQREEQLPGAKERTRSSTARWCRTEAPCGLPGQEDSSSAWRSPLYLPKALALGRGAQRLE